MELQGWIITHKNPFCSPYSLFEQKNYMISSTDVRKITTLKHPNVLKLSN